MLGMFILIICMRPTSSAQIADSPVNQVDDQGRKTGKWILFYDADWNLTNNNREAVYFRNINYEQGKPSGIVKDYYITGELQWEGHLLSENPDVYDGEAIWYDEDGRISGYGYFVGGKLDPDQTFSRMIQMINEYRPPGVRISGNEPREVNPGTSPDNSSNLNALISGQKFQYIWREGGAAYGWFYTAEIHYCPSGQYVSYVRGEKTTVMDNTQYSNNTVKGTWEIANAGGQTIIKHFDQFGNDFQNKYHIPIEINSDGSFSVSKNHNVNISVQRLGMARCN
jgi:hypothetical protein